MCDGAGETLYPVPESAQEVRGNLEFTSYFSTESIEALVQFYDERFAELGWTKADDDESVESAFESLSLTFIDPDGREHYVSIRELSETERAVIISGE